MEKKSGIMAWAIIGAETSRNTARAKRRKIELILCDQVIAARLSNNTLEELDGMANEYGVEEERAQRYLDKASNDIELAK